MLALLLCACGGLSPDPGVRAWLRVPQAQFVEGAMPPAGQGPSVVSPALSRTRAPRGERDLTLTASLDLHSTSVLVGLAGDVGHWVVQAGLADPTVPDFLTVARSLTLALDAPLGPTTLQLEPVTDGEVGPRTELPLEILERTQPSGTLVVSLRWDTPSDLDLHVVDANGVEIWARNPNSWAATPGRPPDPDAWRSGGLLDADSNEACVIDGRNVENVVWTQPPPAGHYLVRVDTFSLCTASAARWSVDVRLGDVRVSSATGVSTPEATRGPHDLGAGLTVLEFDVP
jgi:hypothetical protein